MEVAATVGGRSNCWQLWRLLEAATGYQRCPQYDKICSFSFNCYFFCTTPTNRGLRQKAVYFPMWPGSSSIATEMFAPFNGIEFVNVFLHLCKCLGKLRISLKWVFLPNGTSTIFSDMVIPTAFCLQTIFRIHHFQFIFSTSTLHY